MSEEGKTRMDILMEQNLEKKKNWKKNWCEKEIEEVIKMRETGHSYEEIAEEMKVTSEEICIQMVREFRRCKTKEEIENFFIRIRMPRCPTISHINKEYVCVNRSNLDYNPEYIATLSVDKRHTFAFVRDWLDKNKYYCEDKVINMCIENAKKDIEVFMDITKNHELNIVIADK